MVLRLRTSKKSCCCVLAFAMLMQGPRTAMAFAPAAALRCLSTQPPVSWSARCPALQAAAHRPSVIHARAMMRRSLGQLTVRNMCGPSAPAEKTEEEKAAIKAEREVRKAAKEEEQRKKKAEKEAKAKAEAEAAAAALAELRKPVSYYTSELPERVVGDYEVIQSRGLTGRTWAEVSKLGEEGGAQAGDSVWVRARVVSVRAKGGSCFLALRDLASPSTTVQACHFKSKEDPDGSKTMIKFLQDLTLETIVDIQGTLAAAEVRSCSQSNVEIQVTRCYVVSRSPAILPFLLEDAARSDAEIAASQGSEKPLAAVYQENRLDNRWLDLRVPANNAIMRLQSAVCQLFRESLYQQGFMEIHTPKLIPGESEGGSEVFRTDYFGTMACLAQSPQLYKQMAISADLNKVFEVGPVFRAEKSNTRRHLCEFTGLDLEMAITEHYDEALVVLHKMFKHIFTGMEDRFAGELAVVREQYASAPVRFTDEPCILHWDEGMQMLQDAGEEPDVFGDLSGAHELKLGELVAEKYRADFYILDRYPAAARPFYTMPYPEDARYTNSYDLFIRGQEICSGAQRVHEPELLKKQIAEKGMPMEPLADYIKSFEHGVPPHAGAGIGLERVVFLYLGLDNVRKASMFPRDPNRISP